MHFVSDGQIINSRISATEKFQFGISLGLAKYYSDAISDNVKRAIEAKAAQEENGSQRLLMDIKISPMPDGKNDIIVDEYGSRIIQKVFEWYATGAYSLELACNKIKELNMELIGTGDIWPRFLNNPFYYGRWE